MSVLARAESFRNPGVTAVRRVSRAPRPRRARRPIKSRSARRTTRRRARLPAARAGSTRGARDWRDSRTRTFSTETAGVIKAAVFGNRLRAVARDGRTFPRGRHVPRARHQRPCTSRSSAPSRGPSRAVSRGGARGSGPRRSCSCGRTRSAVGAEASVVRASLMFTLAALAPALGRRSSAAQRARRRGARAARPAPREPVRPFVPTHVPLRRSAIVALALPAALERCREVGEWRPARATPYPPACPRWFRTLGEALLLERAALAARARTLDPQLPALQDALGRATRTRGGCRGCCVTSSRAVLVSLVRAVGDAAAARPSTSTGSRPPRSCSTSSSAR